MGEIHGVRTILLPADNPKDKDVFFKVKTIIENEKFTYLTKDCEEFWRVATNLNRTEYVDNTGIYMWDVEIAAIRKAIAELGNATL